MAEQGIKSAEQGAESAVQGSITEPPGTPRRAPDAPVAARRCLKGLFPAVRVCEGLRGVSHGPTARQSKALHGSASSLGTRRREVRLPRLNGSFAPALPLASVCCSAPSQIGG